MPRTDGRSERETWKGGVSAGGAVKAVDPGIAPLPGRNLDARLSLDAHGSRDLSIEESFRTRMLFHQRARRSDDSAILSPNGYGMDDQMYPPSPWAHGPTGPWADGPLGPWAYGPMGPWAY